MDFYKNIGTLVLGSRLRRLSESILSEVNSVYRLLEIPFDASWFPLFYLLDKKDEWGVQEMADTLNVSHSAVSQLVSNLTQKGLVENKPSKTDGRKKSIALTAEGKQLLLQVKSVWTAIELSMKELNSSELIAKITELESQFEEQPLAERIVRIHYDILDQENEI